MFLPSSARPHLGWLRACPCIHTVMAKTAPDKACWELSENTMQNLYCVVQCCTCPYLRFHRLLTFPIFDLDMLG